MTVLLDTNACIAVMNGRPLAVRERFRQTLEGGETIVVSSITIFELWYGVGKSAHVAANTDQLAAFVTAVEVLPFDEEDARIAGGIRASLRRIGKPIGAYDCLIAGQALRHRILLVTANVAEFSRIEGLRWQDWST